MNLDHNRAAFLGGSGAGCSRMFLDPTVGDRDPFPPSSSLFSSSLEEVNPALGVEIEQMAPVKYRLVFDSLIISTVTIPWL